MTSVDWAAVAAAASAFAAVASLVTVILHERRRVLRRRCDVIAELGGRQYRHYWEIALILNKLILTFGHHRCMTGKCRPVSHAIEAVRALRAEFGSDEFLERLGDLQDALFDAVGLKFKKGMIVVEKLK